MFARIALVALIAVAAIGQSSPIPAGEVSTASGPFVPEPLFHSQSNLVTVRGVVHDASGRALAGLPASAFTVLDNGRPQTITSFSEERGKDDAAVSHAAGNATSGPNPVAAARPRAIALFFDDLHTDSNQMTLARDAAQAFVASDLAPGDRVGVFTASAGLSLNFTGNTAAIQASLATLRPHLRMNPKGTEECPRITPDDAYRIAELHDANVTSTLVRQAVVCNCQNASSSPPPQSRTGRGRAVGARRRKWSMAWPMRPGMKPSTSPS